jgi:hypothetical protein
MKKRIVAFLISLVLFVDLTAQQDTALINRLNNVLKYTQLMDMDKVLDLTYPKLFTIVPRVDLLELMQNSFETDEFSSTLDSLKVDTVFPVFEIQDESFAKVKHTMLMRMKFKNTTDSAAEASNGVMIGLLASQFGEDHVRFDKPNNTITISMLSKMIAVKNKSENLWYFVNFDEENKEMLDLLFSEEVQTKLTEYK